MAVVFFSKVSAPIAVLKDPEVFSASELLPTATFEAPLSQLIPFSLVKVPVPLLFKRA